MRPSAGLIVFLACSIAGTVLAQEDLTQNDFEIDAVTTPVFASGRVTGLAGAYTSLAEGIDGVPFNPAAYAARPAWEIEWWEWDITASISFAGSFAEQDYFNNGLGEGFGVDDFLFLDLGFRLQFGDIGLGALLQSQTFNDLTTGSSVSFLNIHFGAGYSLLDGQLVLGIGGRTTNMSIASDGTSLVDFTGTGGELGGLLRMADWPFRIGLAVRSPVDARVITDDVGPAPEEAAGFVLPRAVALPWEIQAGFAFQLGRPINHRHVEIKKVSRTFREGYGPVRCEREREQVVREMTARGEMPADNLTCPNLGVRAQDREWRRAERLRQRDEDAKAEELSDRAEEELYELWDEVLDSQPREYFLVSVDLLVQGPTDDGVGIDAFLQQVRRRRGEGWHFGFRLGVEGEPWPDRLKLRAGTYLEPGRYQGVSPRMHGTAGLDFRLFELFDIDWRASFTFDGARDYISWGVGVGVWH